MSYENVNSVFRQQEEVPFVLFSFKIKSWISFLFSILTWCFNVYLEVYDKF